MAQHEPEAAFVEPQQPVEEALEQSAESRFRVERGTRRNRLHSIGVRVIDTTPEMRMAAVIVTANSRNRRPMTPFMKSSGMNTAASDVVIVRIVNPISRDPLSDAVSASSPCSMWRTMFSSITIASSTTKPIERMSAIIDRLLRLKFSIFITAKVPSSEKGRASAGMSVAEPLWRKTKMTATTSTSVSSIVSFKTEYQAVFMPNGQVYFGKVEQGTDYITLTGCLLHPGPDEQGHEGSIEHPVEAGQGMARPRRDYISKGAVAMMEPVAADSQVAKLIKEAQRRGGEEIRKDSLNKRRCLRNGQRHIDRDNQQTRWRR